MSNLKRSVALGVLLLVSLVVPIFSSESGVSDASAASSSLETSPLSSPSGQIAPDLSSLIQYTAVGVKPSLRAAHFRLQLDADGQVVGASTPLELPVGLGFSPDALWPSPTGGYTVLMRPIEPGGIPYIFNRRTGKTVSVLSQYGGGSFFGWHPDGRRFLFWIDEVGMWLVDAETQARVMLAKPHGPVQGAAISPDGKTIAYIADNLPKTLGALWLVSSTGGDAKPQIDAGDISFLYPHAWSPDGQRLVYYGDCAGSAQKGTEPAGGPLCIFDLRTQTRQPLRIPFAGYEPNWSLDGRYIAATGFASNAPPCTKPERLDSTSDMCLYKGQSIYVADVVTDQMEEAAPGISPIWSPDGAMLAFLSNRGGASEVWLYNRAKHESKQLTADGKEKSPYGQLLWRVEVSR